MPSTGGRLGSVPVPITLLRQKQTRCLANTAFDRSFSCYGKNSHRNRDLTPTPGFYHLSSF